MVALIWSETIEELRVLGQARTFKNPVSWGVFTCIVYMVLQISHCVLSNCLNEIFTFLDMAVIMTWVGVMYSSIPAITFALKLLKHSIHKIFTRLALHFQPLPNFVANTFQVIVSFALALLMYKTLDDMRVVSHCMRYRLCTEKTGYLKSQKLAQNVCGDSKTCFQWMINAHWCLPLIFGFGFNFFIERLWLADQCPMVGRNVSQRNNQPTTMSVKCAKKAVTPEVCQSRSKKGKSINPRSPNYVPDWHCPYPECPNHSVDYLPRHEDGMIGDNWYCRNEECDQHERFKKSDCIQRRSSQSSTEIENDAQLNEFVTQAVQKHLDQLGREMGRVVCKDCRERINNNKN